MFVYIRWPLAGHQAVRHMVSIKPICVLQSVQSGTNLSLQPCKSFQTGKFTGLDPFNHFNLKHHNKLTEWINKYAQSEGICLRIISPMFMPRSQQTLVPLTSLGKNIVPRGHFGCIPHVNCTCTLG